MLPLMSFLALQVIPFNMFAQNSIRTPSLPTLARRLAHPSLVYFALLAMLCDLYKGRSPSLGNILCHKALGDHSSLRQGGRDFVINFMMQLGKLGNWETGKTRA